MSAFRSNLSLLDLRAGPKALWVSGSLQAIEHDALFGPMLKLFDLARQIGTAITYETGAIG
jgi:hypothetical protein